MAVIPHGPTWQRSLDARPAYSLAGYAVLAAHFGVRFGTLSLARPFALDLARLPERAHLLAILYAGHAAEVALVADHRRRFIAPRSPHFLALREALAPSTGEIDAGEVRRARLTGLAIVRLPQNWIAVEALAARLAVGETRGYLTAHRVIRPPARGG
jgi:hypothetical protein